MELPRQIVVGEKNIDHVGEFLKSLSKPKKVSIISGKNVKKIVGEKIDNSLKKSRIIGIWHPAVSNQVNALNNTEKKVIMYKRLIVAKTIFSYAKLIKLGHLYTELRQ